MYHIIYDLETKFANLKECQLWMNNLILSPKVPFTRMENEDCATPRICVSDTIEGCVTAIGLEGIFRRCCNSNRDTPSYENDNEAYPIIVAELPDNLNYKTPSKQEVPDAAVTGERWLLKPAKPVCEIRWLDAYSIDSHWDKRCGGKGVCDKVRFISNLNGYDHPWINKKGHPLDCSYLGSEVWPDCAPGITPAARALIQYDKVRRRLVFPAPVSNCYAVCYPISFSAGSFSVSEDPYRCKMADLKPFSGFYDIKGRMIFEGDRLVKNGKLYDFNRHEDSYVLCCLVGNEYYPNPSQAEMSELMVANNRPI